MHVSSFASDYKRYKIQQNRSDAGQSHGDAIIIVKWELYQTRHQSVCLLSAICRHQIQNEIKRT